MKEKWRQRRQIEPQQGVDLLGKSRANEICRRLTATFSDPRTELSYISDYTLLVAVVLSAQTTDVQVNKVTSELFKTCKTPNDILTLGFERLAQQIRSIGLYRSKARHIISLSQVLKEKYDSRVPDSREALESLSGVGRKSANVILNTLFKKPAIAVDTHVFRLGRRLGLSQGSSPLAVEKDLEMIVPENYKSSISNLLVLHGRYVCKAKNPNCKVCTIVDLCPSCAAD
ncbi:MAG: endonuclease III [Holosporaceae bacterium]|jgi:endonuclease-3|nr:endonuclease III [Holosporaceae bacterium]